MEELIGKKYNNLTIVSIEKSIALCVCDCGNQKSVKLSDLKRNHVKSCGCKFNGNTIKNTHGNRIYNIWYNMKRRCLDSNNKDYKNYGARGITIYKDWIEDFSSFYNWSIENGYQDNLTLDRINNDGNYQPDNCRWVTIKVQLCNGRRNVIFNINGEPQCLSDICKERNLNYTTIKYRLDKGMDIKEALEKPIDITKSNKKLTERNDRNDRKYYRNDYHT